MYQHKVPTYVKEIRQIEFFFYECHFGLKYGNRSMLSHLNNEGYNVCSP